MDDRRPTVGRFLLLAAGTIVLAACASPADARPARSVAGIDGLSERIADLVERLGPAVVQIRAGPTAGREARPPAAGFIVDAGGTVLTVAHAVPGEDRVEIGLFDGRRLPGKVIGRDPRTDLAAVRVEVTGELPALRLGDSDPVRVGEIVLSLGHPYGLLGAVSLGIVSWKGQPPEGGLPGFDFLHTDALVNPGSSGGPLVNLAGEVIGVNSWAARNGSMGIAVPSALVKLVLPRLIADGRVEWGWMGLDIAGTGPVDPASPGPRDSRGLVIQGVTPEGPAARAGLKAGDVLVAVDGQPVVRPRDLHRMILVTPAGGRVRLTVQRDEQRRSVEVSPRSYYEARGDVRAGTEFPPFDLAAHPPDRTF